jgi:poly-gamma-glutamate capsule biosynthesis protein CapA/YwtB (metallophosphatase superfamily)
MAAPASVSAATYSFDTSEAAFDAAYLKLPISLGATLVDATGKPIADATVTVLGFGVGAMNNGRTAVSNATGGFTIDGLTRRSALLKITRAGWYTEIVPVDLQRPSGEASLGLGKIVMTAQKTGRARLVFVGDTMFGRRFTDADEDGKQGEPGDLINPATRAADAQKIVTYVRDALSAADYSVANLECTVTSDPATPHPYKSYTFYSHPETLAGLTYAGIDGVDLANNHVFDYLTAGVEDTIAAVGGETDEDIEFDWTGAGMNETLAADTTINVTKRGVPLALQGFSTLRRDGSSLTKYLLVALDPDKAGALEATATNMTDFLSAEVGSSFAVPMIHGGVEYSSYPANNMRGIFVSLIKQGAGLVVAHHTHTMHGIGLVDPGTGPRFVLMSLGNFIFDQTTFETTQSLIAVVDVETKSGSQEVTRLQMIPVHVERYVPKLLAGDWLARAGRQLGHLSSTLPKTPSGSGTADGLTGATVFQSGSQVVAFKSASQFTTKDSVETLKPSLSGGATGLIEYKPTGPADSLAAVKTGVTAAAEYGREILLYGDFEDSDVDGDFSEGTAWNQSESRYVENSVVHGGTGAVVLLRKSSNDSTVSMSNFRDIPIPGGAKLTIRGWVRRVNAGTFKLTTKIYDSDGDTLSTTDRVTISAGSNKDNEWTRFSVDFVAPSSAADLELFFKQSPPASGEGQVFVDDVAVIQWDGKVSDAKAGFTLPTPNNYGFLRFTGASGSTLDISLTHRSYTAL